MSGDSFLRFMQERFPERREEKDMVIDEVNTTGANLPKADFQTLYNTIKNIENDSHFQKYGELMGSLNKSLQEIEIMSQSFNTVIKKK